MELAIEFRGIPMLCHGDWHGGEEPTMFSHGCAEDFELVACYINNQDIFEMLSREQISEIETAILDKIVHERKMGYGR